MVPPAVGKEEGFSRLQDLADDCYLSCRGVSAPRGDLGKRESRRGRRHARHAFSDISRRAHPTAAASQPLISRLRRATNGPATCFNAYSESIALPELCLPRVYSICFWSGEIMRQSFRPMTCVCNSDVASCGIARGRVIWQSRNEDG